MSIRQPASDNREVKTLRLTVDTKYLHGIESRRAIAQAASILRRGGLVALPTETVYGLGANALDAAAVARIFEAKRRPSWDPIIVHIAGPLSANPMLDTLVDAVPDSGRKLIERFWPGPLTLLLPRSKAVPDSVTAGRRLVGIRMPAHPVALQLIEAAELPIAAPSANLFGHISPTTADHVLEDLDGRVDAVLDAGPTEHGVESTVLDPNQTPMIIYRPGAITAEQIRSIAGPAEIFQPATPEPSAPQEALPSPGVGIRHYAPRAQLIVIDAPLADLSMRFAQELQKHAGQTTGLMLPTELSGVQALRNLPETIFFDWGHWNAPQELARNLYAGLRTLDAQGCAVILCPLPPSDGLGAALSDRLKKAAR